MPHKISTRSTTCAYFNSMRLALYEPDIPPNTGSLLRLCACFGIPLDIIEPCGFPLSDRALKRAGMDYIARANLTLHRSFPHFRGAQGANRLVLLTTRADLPYTAFSFSATDTLLLGRESAGVPEEIHNLVDMRVRIPIREGLRSLNVAMAGAIVLAEALRQTGQFPTDQPDMT